MEGYDLESDFIKEKLTKQWKDKRFTSKQPILGTKASEQKVKKQYEPIWSDSKLQKKAEKAKKKAEDLPVKKETFEEAFPRLSKIIPKFIKNSRLGKAMVKSKQKREQKNNKDNINNKVEITPQQEYESNKTEEFKDTLKLDYEELLEIANKGELGVKKEKLDRLKEEAAKKEKENIGKSQEQKLAETEANVDVDAYMKKLDKGGR